MPTTGSNAISLTRDDYFLGNGDDYSFNATLFGMMVESTGRNIGREQMALHRKKRHHQSLQDNENFLLRTHECPPIWRGVLLV